MGLSIFSSYNLGYRFLDSISGPLKSVGTGNARNKHVLIDWSLVPQRESHHAIQHSLVFPIIKPRGIEPSIMTRTARSNAMDMRDEWLSGLRSWADDNGNVRELWLFGSRATGCSRPDSDVDIAIALMPCAADGTDWALGNYFALHSVWKRQLEAIVGRHVSLEVIVPNTPEDEEVRCTGRLLWTPKS